MKTDIDGITKALEEVWEMKQAVYEDIKDMTFEERRAYFQKGLEEAARILGAELVENPDGTWSFVDKKD